MGRKKKPKQQCDKPPIQQEPISIQAPPPQQLPQIQSIAIQATNFSINLPILIEENKQLREENARLHGELGIKNALLCAKIEELSKRDKQIEELIAQNERLAKENAELKALVETHQMEISRLDREICGLRFQSFIDKLINAIQDANRIFTLEQVIPAKYAAELREMREDRNAIHYIRRTDSIETQNYKFKILAQYLRDGEYAVFIEELDAQYGDDFANAISRAIEEQLRDKSIGSPTPQILAHIDRYWLK